MTNQQSDPFKAQRSKAEERLRDTSIPTSAAVREIEIFLLTYGCMSNSPLAKIQRYDDFLGGGILVAKDVQGRRFKIEISELGPE